MARFRAVSSAITPQRAGQTTRALAHYSSLIHLCALAICCALALTSFAGEITIGSFNIEWFGHGNKPRSDEQIQQLAYYIRSLEVDILACQEISPTGDKSGNGVADWQDLKRELGEDFKTWCGDTGGSQHLAFIWRSDRVEVEDYGELKGIQRESVP
ncbi:MAG: hypothetical protein ABIH23_13595, partial [bacterium]